MYSDNWKVILFFTIVKLIARIDFEVDGIMVTWTYTIWQLFDRVNAALLKFLNAVTNHGFKCYFLKKRFSNGANLSFCWHKSKHLVCTINCWMHSWLYTNLLLLSGDYVFNIRDDVWHTPTSMWAISLVFVQQVCVLLFYNFCIIIFFLQLISYYLWLHRVKRWL